MGVVGCGWLGGGGGEFHCVASCGGRIEVGGAVCGGCVGHDSVVGCAVCGRRRVGVARVGGYFYRAVAGCYEESIILRAGRHRRKDG